jgi:UDP-N-acetylmuramoyl-L-alanyl-D-glutamate--2,6-diaminopimelate ligase
MRLAELAAGFPLQDSADYIEITGITADSRAVLPGMMFAALPGTKADGISFVSQALAQGAAAILAVEGAATDRLPVPVLKSPNPRRELALLAARFYAAQPAVIAGVTGTNGKTSVTSFLRQIWQHAGHRSASLGTVGVVTASGEEPLLHTTPDPIMLHEILRRLSEQGISHLAIEASSHGLDQHRLDGVTFAAAAFTNITRDHFDYHGTFQNYLAAKLRLFQVLLPDDAPVVIDMDAPGAGTVAEACAARDLPVFGVGHKGVDLELRSAVAEGFQQRLQVVHQGETHDVHLPLAGSFQVSNALVAAGLAIVTGTGADTAFDALSGLRGAKGRLELAGFAPGGAPVFIDYAHTPDALQKALEALRPYAGGRLHVVFGCGGERDPGKRPEMGRIAAAFADCVIVTDDNPRGEDAGKIRAEILAAAPKAVEIGARAEAIAYCVSGLRHGDLLLVAGKGHETGQTIAGKTTPYSDHDAVANALRDVNAPAGRMAAHG